MIIPYSTDAPLYHRPWATIVLMVATVAAFIATGGDTETEAVQPWLLSHGQGLHPLQWITSNFIHHGPGHLIGNLIGLWTFAMIVEGKVGFFPFLAIYLGIGFVECGLEQVLALGMTESDGSFGSSAIVFGIMAMAMVWAPKNEVTCFWSFGWRWGAELELPIVLFALFYIALEVFEVFFWGALIGLNATTAVLHLLGAAVGFGLGTLMLKRAWVDCENWDFYTVMLGHQSRSGSSTSTSSRVKAPKAKAKAKAKAKRSAEPAVSTEDRSATSVDRMKAKLEAGDVVAALAVYDKSVRTIPGWMPPDAEWIALIQALLAASDWGNGVTLMEDYLRRSPKPSVKVRLRLAQILVKEQKRPTHALKVLGEIPDGALPVNLATTAEQLRRHAEQMVEEGVLELDGQSW